MRARLRDVGVPFEVRTEISSRCAIPGPGFHQLGLIAAQSRHEFWTDQVPFTDVALTGVIGHRQVTDAYLTQLARSREGRLATFDPGLPQLHHDVVDFVPTA